MLAHPQVQGDQRKRLYLTLGEVSDGENGGRQRRDRCLQRRSRPRRRAARGAQRARGAAAPAQAPKLLEDAYTRQLQRLPATEPTRLARAGLWRSLGDLRKKDLHDEGAALAAYLASAELTPDDAPAQEALAAFATQVKGNEEVAIAAWRRALPTTDDQGRVCIALGELR